MTSADEALEIDIDTEQRQGQIVPASNVMLNQRGTGIRFQQCYGIIEQPTTPVVIQHDRTPVLRAT